MQSSVLSAQSACVAQRVISAQSACVRVSLWISVLSSVQSACNQHATSMQPAYNQLDEGGHQSRWEKRPGGGWAAEATRLFERKDRIHKRLQIPRSD